MPSDRRQWMEKETSAAPTPGRVPGVSAAQCRSGLSEFLLLVNADIFLPAELPVNKAVTLREHVILSQAMPRVFWENSADWPIKAAGVMRHAPRHFPARRLSIPCSGAQRVISATVSHHIVSRCPRVSVS